MKLGELKKAFAGAVACVLFAAMSLSAIGEEAFRGVITDSMCSGTAGHAAKLTKGMTLANCAVNCVKMGAKYVLLNPGTGKVYQLDDQTRPAALAARNVVVIGTLDGAADSIHVSAVILALPPKVLQAKSVYIDCDACVRRMAKAKEAALRGVVAWDRFRVVADRRQADLILLFSANPYLGDYVSREGPDTRLVRVNITYMNVIDPRTGESLWGDSRDWGSFMVADATGELIDEFRAHLEANQGLVDRLLVQDSKRKLKADQNPGK